MSYPKSWHPKGLIEHLNSQYVHCPNRRTRHLMELMLEDLKRHRPVGSDGKHGGRHTETCGCEDKS